MMIARQFFMSAIVAATVAAAATGCGQRQTHEDYVPETGAARRAVEAALVDWQQGHAPGRIALEPAAIQVVDTRRKSNQTLESFEILGEVPAESTRCFAVQVTLANPAANERLRFCVIGIDPMWVFRLEDFENLAHWDHEMPAEPAKSSGESVAAEAITAKDEPPGETRQEAGSADSIGDLRE
jgi:hypothetical protein